MYTVLGAGLAGISASYHLGHENCVLYEKKNHIGGHIHTEIIDGFTWDEGPHVSFTKHQYVKDLFSKSVAKEYLEYPVETGNYYNGYWIPHPAQSNLFAVPQPLRDKCLYDFLLSRSSQLQISQINNYEEWLIAAFGKAFYENFPKKYTQKYWTLNPNMLTTDWVGERVYYPDVEEVKHGYINPLPKQTHYISHVRYPKNGGYQAFSKIFENDSNVKLNHELEHISFKNQKLFFKNGHSIQYDYLINTLPLPLLIKISDAEESIKEAASQLSCSSVLLINISCNHNTLTKLNWIYVYDDDKFSTRINCTELLSPNNAPNGKSGIQVEVYFSKYKPKTTDDNTIAQKVIEELIEMGLINSVADIITYHIKWVQWANVIFDHNRKDALNKILSYLEQHGLERHDQDLLPMTDWNKYKKTNGKIQLAGRFAEWKYYWTDDCVMRYKP